MQWKNTRATALSCSFLNVFLSLEKSISLDISINRYKYWPSMCEVKTVGCGRRNFPLFYPPYYAVAPCNIHRSGASNSNSRVIRTKVAYPHIASSISPRAPVLPMK